MTKLKTYLTTKLTSHMNRKRIILKMTFQIQWCLRSQKKALFNFIITITWQNKKIFFWMKNTKYQAVAIESLAFRQSVAENIILTKYPRGDRELLGTAKCKIQVMTDTIILQNMTNTQTMQGQVRLTCFVKSVRCTCVW